jgi:hypothetical protein
MRLPVGNAGPFDHTARPRRGGCAGCLIQTTVALLGGCVLMYGLFVLLAPWNFYFGGHFHAVPGWSGGGWLHAPAAGGNYYLWLRFDPTIPGYRKSPIQGDGYLCTPRRQKFRLHFGGAMPRQHGTDLRGVPIHLYLFNWPVLANIVGDRRPSFDLYGTFGDSQLVMDDRGSLTRAFRPDGTLHGSRDNTPWKQPSTQVTVRENSAWWVFNPSCPAAPE